MSHSFDDDFDEISVSNFSACGDGDFEYEEAASADELLAELDNLYHEAAAALGSDRRNSDSSILGNSIETFTSTQQSSVNAVQVLLRISRENDPERAELAFKACRKLTKHFLRICCHTEAFPHYIYLLRLVSDNAVTRNRAEKSILGIIAMPSSESIDSVFDFCSATLVNLSNANYSRVHVACQLRLAHAYLARSDFAELSKILPQLVVACHSPDGSEDRRRNQDLMEVYSLMIEFYSLRHDYKRLRDLYCLCLGVSSISPHPRIMAKIHECGGKMYMRQKSWNSARTAFFLAFKNYDEAGMADRIRVLKYLVLACMLDQSSINPFDSQETLPYKDDPCVNALTDLVGAHQSQDRDKFESILQAHHAIIMDDEFTREYVDQLKSACLSRTLLHIIKPYTCIKLSFLATWLSTTIEIVENELVALILEGKICGARIDLIQNCLIFDENYKKTKKPFFSKSSLLQDDQKSSKVIEQSSLPCEDEGEKLDSLLKWSNYLLEFCKMFDEKYFAINSQTG